MAVPALWENQQIAEWIGRKSGDQWTLVLCLHVRERVSGKAV